MSIKIYNKQLKDKVLGAYYYIGETNYGYAIETLFPLIQRLDIQRNLQRTNFYSRLRSDLKKGCVMPAITISFITELSAISDSTKFINENIKDAFILDGIQRLNALKQAFNELDDKEKDLFKSRILHLNLIISPSMDKLLYRMITLNNGQKPMSPRHQIDILSETILDFSTLELRNQSHKNKQNKGDKLSVHRSDIVKGYIAFLSNTTAIDNKLIIEEKMDELIAERIIDSDVPDDKYEFLDILKSIAEFCSVADLFQWFKVSNNFIGFCVACRSAFSIINSYSQEEIATYIDKFEKVFMSFDKKKIRVGDYRRKLVAEYFSNIETYKELSITNLTLELSTK